MMLTPACFSVFSKIPHPSSSLKCVVSSVAAKTSRLTFVFGKLVVLWAPADTTVTWGGALSAVPPAGILLPIFHLLLTEKGSCLESWGHRGDAVDL